MYGFKECSSCEALYNKSCGCSKRGFIDKFVRNPNKTPDSSQRPPHNCLKCKNPVDGLYCRQRALLRKKLKEVWFTICVEHEIFQDFLNTSESSNDNTNVVSASPGPFVFNQNPDENSSQNPPHIDHHCCYECGDSLDSIFCQQCTCESCGNDAHIGYNCPSKVLIMSNPEPCHNQNVDEFPQTLPSFHPTCYSGDENSFAYYSTPNFVDDSPSELAEYINTSSWNCPAFYNYDDDDNEDYTISITPEEHDNSLSMGDENLDTIAATKSNGVIKSSVEDLFPIPSESEGIPDNMCDVPFRDNSLPLDISKDQFENFSDSNDDSTSIDDDYFSIDNIDYVEIESLNDNPTPGRMLKSPSPFSIPVEDSDSFFEKFDTSLFYLDNSLPEFKTFSDHTEETNSGSTTTHADNSLPKYDSFLFEIKPDQGKLTSVVMEDNLGEPRVHVPNVLPTHPTLMLDSDFIPSDNSLPESKIFCFDILEKNSGSTTIRADISISDLEFFYFKSAPNPRDLISIVDYGIRENVSSTINVNTFEEDHSPLLAYLAALKLGCFKMLLFASWRGELLKLAAMLGIPIAALKLDCFEIIVFASWRVDTGKDEMVSIAVWQAWWACNHGVHIVRAVNEPDEYEWSLVHAKGRGSCWGSLIEVVGKSVDSGGVAGNVGMEVEVFGGKKGSNEQCFESWEPVLARYFLRGGAIGLMHMIDQMAGKLINIKFYTWIKARIFKQLWT
uniref:Uncharacterized protein n=1 Tax=Tanacetum cinerariifolium TaxID=118510 RepID=A0A6L2NN37_TANCI|nr:hypothetical protein [Tanacetum cinerariifolium]